MNNCRSLFVLGRCRESFRRSRLKQTLLLAACLVAASMFAPAAYAQSGMIGASANPCTIPGGGSVCTSTISFSSSGTSEVEVWVAANGGAESEFASAGVGGPYYQDATWIEVSTSYVFTLYDYSSGSRGATLANVTVTGVYAVTLTWGNSTNSAITPSLVSGDYWTLTISGAPPYATISYGVTVNGGSLNTYNYAVTGAGGSYYGYAETSDYDVAYYTTQWYVGGAAAGINYHYECIYRPSELLVLSSGVWSTCDPSSPYGTTGTIDYLIENSAGYPVTADIIVLYPFGSVNSGPAEPVDSASEGADSIGKFTYQPIGRCSATAFGTSALYSEILFIKIGSSSVEPSVRSQSWTVSGSAPYHGEVTNGTDVDIVE